MKQEQLQAEHAPGRQCYVGRLAMLKMPLIEATSLIDLDHWCSVIVRAGWITGGWLDYSSWLAIQSKRPFVCLCNNELIVTQSIRGIGIEMESILL